MSVTAQSHVWKYSKAKGSALLVLLAIADYAHDDGTNAWPTLASLAKKTRMTERSMRLILHQLVAGRELRIRENAEQLEVKGGYVPRRFMDVLCARRAGKKEAPGKDFTDPEEPAEILNENSEIFEGSENFSGEDLSTENLTGEETAAPGKILHGTRKNSDISPEKSGTAYKEDPSGSIKEIRQREGECVRPVADPSPADLVTTWNSRRFPGPKVHELTPSRARLYRRALAAKPDLAAWASAIVWLNAQAYANAPGTGEHGTWRASLDWLAKPGQLAQILEQVETDALAPQRGRGRLTTDADATALRQRRLDAERDQEALVAEAAALVLNFSDAERAVLERDVLRELEDTRQRVSASTFDDMVLRALPLKLIERAHGRPLTLTIDELKQEAP